ncbi:MAG TPA: winged helix-turn-helix transcriptional regulator [Halanaerobiaceae bacterium]|jgi:DNA-binding MarR family transcriptional regulator|nr:MarR family winged helix-turn-helix transcriptional regulator [Bacillota bacterium]HHU92298.1 winged helix-turn-helix transcriptional regulator [Halanaerobiaceae bacterium]HOA41500.1 MarR family winged helix-turn-helix transcriptional regulator [Halanaerobiales bacterium]HPZ62265.1 MarR family winged helix-turn-helix transcriptional regulator [Halanaerobiales bacterium]HQD03579.1 MarR family winged helix-turn-helix transcriptional regulator [Halanaerobiales bacterium]
MNITDFKFAILEYTRKINENINKLFNPIFAEYGLTMLQGRILMELFHFGILSIGNLAESINVAGANASAMCKKLENMGYLNRARDKADERVVQVDLTDRGREILLQINEKMNELISRELYKEGEESFREIIRGMEKLNDILERIVSCNQ